MTNASIRQLLDKEAIREVLVRYAAGIDNRDQRLIEHGVSPEQDDRAPVIVDSRLVYGAGDAGAGELELQPLDSAVRPQPHGGCADETQHGSWLRSRVGPFQRMHRGRFACRVIGGF